MEVKVIEQLAKAFSQGQRPITAEEAQQTLETYLGRPASQKEGRYLMMRYRRHMTGKGMRVTV